MAKQYREVFPTIDYTTKEVVLTKTRLSHFDVGASCYIPLSDLDLSPLPLGALPRWAHAKWINGEGGLTIIINPSAARIGCCRFSKQTWKKLVRAVKAAQKNLKK